MANFVDILIDYPNSKIYIEQLFQRLLRIEVLTDKQVSNYWLHIENVEKQGIDLDIEWSNKTIFIIGKRRINHHFEWKKSMKE